MQTPENYNNLYKNYLPGKKIWITLFILISIALIYFVAIPLVIKIKKDGIPPAKPLSLDIVFPSGDPTTRDSDGDSIPDWQEIAVGLDPHKKETSTGVPDEQLFNTIKGRIGADAFDQATNDSSTTDRLSLTIAHDIDQSALLTGSTIDKSLSEASVNEILNYIDSQKKSYTVYTSDNITVIQNTLANNQTYVSKMGEVLKEDATTKNTATDIKDYASGTGSKQKVDLALQNITTALAALKTVPVPSAAVDLHLAVLNALQGLSETTRALDPTTDDEIKKLGSLSLLQDYAIQLSTSLGKLSVYFSIALNKNGYVQ